MPTWYAALFGLLTDLPRCSASEERCSTLGEGGYKLPQSAREPAAVAYAVLKFALENGELWPIAVLLLDSQDRLHVRLRAGDELARKIPKDGVEVVALSLDQIAEDARAGSGREVLRTLEDQLSNTIRISDRKKTEIPDIQKALDDLYEQYIAPLE